MQRIGEMLIILWAVIIPINCFKLIIIICAMSTEIHDWWSSKAYLRVLNAHCSLLFGFKDALNLFICTHTHTHTIFKLNPNSTQLKIKLRIGAGTEKGMDIVS